MSKPEFEREPIFSESMEIDEPPRIKRRWPLLGVLVLVGVFLILRAAIVRMQPPTRSGRVKPNPDERLEGLTFQPITTDKGLSPEDIAGKVTLINFWGPWCFPCRMEFPELMKIYDLHRSNRDFVFISVSCPSAEGVDPLDDLLAETRQFLTEVKANFPVYHDDGVGARRTIIKTLHSSGWSYPTTVLVDKKGLVHGLWVGYTPGDGREIEEIILELLRE